MTTKKQRLKSIKINGINTIVVIPRGMKKTEIPSKIEFNYQPSKMTIHA